MKCKKCNGENPDGVKFCNQCGSSFESELKSCPKTDCGRKGLPVEAIYCPDCGALLESENPSVNKQVEKATPKASLSGSKSKTQEVNTLKSSFEEIADKVYKFLTY